MRLLAVLVVAAVGLGACAPMQWVKPDADVDQVRRDEQACQQAAWREAQFQSYWYQSRMQPVIVGPGQVIWPGGPFVDPFAEQVAAENRLAQFCMESKGYQLVPAQAKK